MSSYELALRARIFTSVDVEQLAKRARTEQRREDRPLTEIVNPELPGILINEWREQALETLGIEADQLPKDAESQLERTTEEEEAWDSL